MAITKQIIDKQSAMRAYNDIYRFMGLAFLSVAPFILIRNVKRT